MHNFAKRVTSAVIAGAVVLGTLAFYPTGNKGKVNAAELYDSASSINYATILGGAVDYGIVAESIEQKSHMETTFATNLFTNTTNANNDVDYIKSTALFLIDKLSPGSKIYLGKTTASAVYIEGESSVFGDTYNPSYQVPSVGGSNGNLVFGGEYNNVPVIQAVNPNADVNVDRLQNRICSSTAVEDVEMGWSYFLNSRATGETGNKYLLNPDGQACPNIKFNDSSVSIDITDPEYNGKVVYVNVTSRMMDCLKQNGSFHIYKNPSSIVVFNITESAISDDVCKLSKPILHCNNEQYVGTTAVNGNNNSYGYDANSDGVNAAAVQKYFNETIIWNVMTTKEVVLDSTGGLLLAPKTSLVNLASGNSSGWIVTEGKVQVNCEFHFLYSGSSKDGYGQMHFALIKGFTHKYAPHAEQVGEGGESVVPDNSVEIPEDTYKFYIQEYDRPSIDRGELTTPIGNSQEVYVETNGTVTFPTLQFYCENYDLLTTEQRNYYIEKPQEGADPNFKMFYFKVTEDPSSPEGISNSDGYIDIRLKVQVDSKGNFTYFVDYQSMTGNNILFREYGKKYGDFIKMSGIQFDLGTFYNKVEEGLVICKTAVTGGDEIDGAVLKIRKISGENAFPVDSITAVRNNADGTTTTLARVDSGSEPGDDQVLFDSASSTISYKTNSSGHVTITGIPDGEYELVEETTPAGYKTAETIKFKIVNGNVQSCSSANGNTITMIDKIEVGVKIAKEIVGSNGIRLNDAKLTLISDDGYDLSGVTIQNAQINRGADPKSYRTFTTQNGDAAELTNLPAGRYTLIESDAPDGYAMQKEIKFSIDGSGKVTFLNDIHADEGTVVNPDSGLSTITMYDGIHIQVKKVDEEGKSLSEAKFQIYESDGQTPVGSHFYGGDWDLNLPAGNYILREEQAPANHASAPDYRFEVKNDGTIYHDGTAVVNNTIVVVDKNGFIIEVEKMNWVSGTGFVDLAGATLTITASDGTQGNSSWTWTSDASGEKHKVTGLLPGVTYTLSEVTSPGGYKKFDPIEFTITPDGQKCVLHLSSSDEARTIDDFNSHQNSYSATDGDIYLTHYYNPELRVIDQESKIGTLVITKQINGLANSSVVDSDTIVFTITGPADFNNGAGSASITYSDFTNGSYTFNNVPEGDYTVEETINGVSTEYTLKTTYVNNVETTSATINPITRNNNTAIFAFENEYEDTTPTPATVEITKTLVLEDSLTLNDLDTIEFTISPSLNGVTTLQLDVDDYATAGWTRTGAGTSASPYVYTYTFDNVANDTYTITESNNGIPTARQDIDCTTNPATKSTTVTISDTVRRDIAEFTNTYSDNTTSTNGSLVIYKKIVLPANTQNSDIGTIDFSIYDSNMTEIFTVTLDPANPTANGWSLYDTNNNIFKYTYTPVTPGEDYYVEEKCNIGSANYSVISSANGATLVNIPVQSEQGEVTYTNTYSTVTAYTGSLVIEKTIVLPAGASMSDIGDITFTITPDIAGVSTIVLDPDNPGAGWVVNGNVFTYTFDNLVQGVAYTVEETVDGSTSSYSVTATRSSQDPVTIPTDTTGNTSVSAGFTNTYSSTLPTVGYIEFTKTFGGDVTEAEAAGCGLYFVITNDAGEYLDIDGNISSDEVRITLKDMDHTDGTLVWSKTITDVPFDTYYVTEHNEVIYINGGKVPYTFEKTTSVTTDHTTLWNTSEDGYFDLENYYTHPGFDVTISKEDIAGKEIAQAQLKFTSIDGYDLSNLVVTQNGTPIQYTLSDNNTSITFITVEGYPSIIQGLFAGTYELEETVTPEAYLTAEKIVFVLNNDGTITDGEGKISAYGSPVVMIDQADPYYNTEVISANRTPNPIPATGEQSNYIAIVGIALVGLCSAALAGLGVYRKKRNEY